METSDKKDIGELDTIEDAIEIRMREEELRKMVLDGIETGDGQVVKLINEMVDVAKGRGQTNKYRAQNWAFLSGFVETVNSKIKLDTLRHALGKAQMSYDDLIKIIENAVEDTVENIGESPSPGEPPPPETKLR